MGKTRKKKKKRKEKETRVPNSVFPSFNLSMFTEEDGTTINNEDRK